MDSQDSLIERINKIMSHFNVNISEFASKTNIAQGNMSSMLNKKRAIGDGILNKICISFDISKNWLLTGEGDMLKKNTNTPPKTTEHNKELTPFEYLYTLKDFFDDYYSYLDYSKVESNYLEKQLRNMSDIELGVVANAMGLSYDDLLTGVEIVSKTPRSGKLVPIYNTAAAAGNGVVELPSTREGWVNVGDLLKDSEGSLYVYGNSMIPGYPPGSLVGIRPLNESFIEPGSVYVVQTDSNRYIKRLYNNEDNTGLVCLSDNHIKHTDGPMEGKYLYPPFEIPMSSVKIIYKVTGVIKRNSMTYM